MPVGGVGNHAKNPSSSVISPASIGRAANWVPYLMRTRLNPDVLNLMIDGSGIDVTEQVDICLTTTDEVHVDLHLEQRAAKFQAKEIKP